MKTINKAVFVTGDTCGSELAIASGMSCHLYPQILNELKRNNI